MTYRVYYGGGDPREAWIIQEQVGVFPAATWKTVAAVAQVLIAVPSHLPVPAKGARPNGVLLAEGRLRVENFTMPEYAVRLGWQKAWIE